MSSHGTVETQKLKANIQDQLTRLMLQLQDLEDLRAELDDDEYEETRKDTLEQLEVRATFCGPAPAALCPPEYPQTPPTLARSRPPPLPLPPQEFDGQLKRLMDGDMTLVSELGQLKLAIRAAISNAFQTPEVIKSFAAREPATLRARLVRLGEDLKLGRLTDAGFKAKALEVVFALKKLGEELSAEEKVIMDSASQEAKKAFEAAGEGDGAVGEAALASLAKGKGGGGGGGGGGAR